MGFYCLQKYNVWLYVVLTASIRTFFLCFTNYSLGGGCQKRCR